jgi:hypothetical protein
MKLELHPVRVLLKAIVLFIVLNVVYAIVDPSVGSWARYALYT